MDRRYVWLVGVGVVGIAVMLAVRFYAGCGTSETARTEITPATPTTRRAERHPSLPDEPRDRAAGTPVTRETVTDTARIRDHRAEPGPVQGGTPRPPDTRKIPAQVVHDLSLALQAALADCAALIPETARGSRPKAEGVVRVDVAGGALKVTEASVQLRDVHGDANAAKQCLEQKWVGQATPAVGAEDTTGYSITVTFALPSA
jgi:hypothetical protein